MSCAANLAGDLDLFDDESLVRYDDDAVNSYNQVWQVADESMVAEYRAKQTLAQWQIPVDDAPARGPSTDTIPGSVAQEIELADGCVSSSGAFVLSLPLDDLGPLATTLEQAGYRPQSIRPYQINDRWCVAACWQTCGRESKCQIELTKAQLLAEQETMLEQGFQLVDLGGYAAESQDSGEHFYAVWQQEPSQALSQIVVLGVDPDETRTNFESLQNDYEPVLRQHYYTALGVKRFCEVWEEFESPVPDPWFAYTTETSRMKGLIREFSQYPARYLHLSVATDGRAAYCSGVWRSDAEPLRTYLVWNESVEVVSSVSAKMVRAGYRPRNVCVATSQFTAPIAAAIWEAPADTP